MIAAAMLASLDLFQGIPAAALEELAASVSTRTFAPNQELMAVDHGSELFYLILSGTVRVHVEEADGSEVLLAILGPSELLGEVSMLDGRKPSATVTALDRTECLAMDCASFREAIRSVPMLAYNFAKILAARLRLANAHTQALAA